MNLQKHREQTERILKNLDAEIKEIEESKKYFIDGLAWAEKVAKMKMGDILYRKPYKKFWKGKNITILKIDAEADNGCGVAVYEVETGECKSAEWYEPAKPHRLHKVVVANGAGKGVCECGCWESKVSDDGLIFTDDEYYFWDDIEKDFLEHLRKEGMIV